MKVKNERTLGKFYAKMSASSLPHSFRNYVNITNNYLRSRRVSNNSDDFAVSKIWYVVDSDWRFSASANRISLFGDGDCDDYITITFIYFLKLFTFYL